MEIPKQMESPIELTWTWTWSRNISSSENALRRARSRLSQWHCSVLVRVPMIWGFRHFHNVFDACDIPHQVHLQLTHPLDYHFPTSLILHHCVSKESPQYLEWTSANPRLIGFLTHPQLLWFQCCNGQFYIGWHNVLLNLIPIWVLLSAHGTPTTSTTTPHPLSRSHSLFDIPQLPSAPKFWYYHKPQAKDVNDVPNAWLEAYITPVTPLASILFPEYCPLASITHFHHTDEESFPSHTYRPHNTQASLIPRAYPHYDF